MTLESEVRDTLRAAARATRVPDGLADRLVATAQRPATGLRTPGGRRPHRTWVVPVLAAAVVILVVGAVTLTAVLAGRSHRHEPASPVVTPTVSVPTPAPTSTPAHSSSPPPSPSTPARTAAPADFRAADVQFRDSLHATALGIGDCTGSGTGSCRVSLIATDDGGASWYRLGAPAGLHPMFPTSGSDGSCMDNGDVLGPCIDAVLFPDAAHGYLWGLHAMYSTADGGRTWTDQGTGVGFGGAQAVAVGGRHVYRVVPTSEGSVASVPAQLQVSTLGSTTWTDISPSRSLSWFSDVVATPGAVLVADQSTDQSASPAVRLFRSTDNGGHWSQVGSTELTRGLAAGPDGAVAALTHTGTACSLTSVSAGGTITVTPVQVPCGQSSGAQTSIATLVGLTGSGNRILRIVPETGSTNAYPVTISRVAPNSSQAVEVGTFQVPAQQFYGGRARFAGDVGTILLGDAEAALTTDGGSSWHTIRF